MTFFGGSFDSISSFDASYVQLIHSNAGYFGISQSRGHVDFFPNGILPKLKEISQLIKFFLQAVMNKLDARITQWQTRAITVDHGKCIKRAFAI